MLKAFSLLGYAAMMGAVVGLLLMKSLVSPSPYVITIQVASLVLFFWARITFGRRSFHLAANPTEGGLVTSGPYRYIRHPIYSALCLFAWAGLVAHWSWQAVACGALMVGGAVLRIRCEEPLVTALYPQYKDYARRTWRMIPFIY